MSTHQITEGSVVVGVDGSPSSELALRWAVDEARRTRQLLHVVHALETELVISDKHQLGTKEAPASSDQVLTAAVDVVRTICLLYTSPSPRDRTRSRMPSSA